MMTASGGLTEAFNSPARGAMHMLVRFLVASFLATAALGQSRPAEPVNKVRISKLVIESNSLPAAEREQIIRSFQQKTYFQPEIGERIRQALQDMGYFKAAVDEPTFPFPPQVEEKGIANVTVKVEPGTQYRLGQIRFEKATVFPSAQLRDLFALRNGEPFSRTAFIKGLESMRKLYETKGYVNFVATPVPMFEESRRTIDMVIDIDEGKPFNFGQLLLEGVEPHAGAANALKDSWKPLMGKRYNSLELQNWLLTHHADWKVSPDSVKLVMDAGPLIVNVKLTQWPN
jgi:Surface antigen variable number repeat